MPFNLLFSVWIVFFNVPKSPVMLDKADQSKSLVLSCIFVMRLCAYKHKKKAIIAVVNDKNNIVWGKKENECTKKNSRLPE